MFSEILIKTDLPSLRQEQQQQQLRGQTTALWVDGDNYDLPWAGEPSLRFPSGFARQPPVVDHENSCCDSNCHNVEAIMYLVTDNQLLGTISEWEPLYDRSVSTPGKGVNILAGVRITVVSPADVTDLPPFGPGMGATLRVVNLNARDSFIIDGETRRAWYDNYRQTWIIEVTAPGYRRDNQQGFWLAVCKLQETKTAREATQVQDEIMNYFSDLPIWSEIPQQFVTEYGYWCDHY